MICGAAHLNVDCPAPITCYQIGITCPVIRCHMQCRRCVLIAKQLYPGAIANTDGCYANITFQMWCAYGVIAAIGGYGPQTDAVVACRAQ